MKHEPAQQVQVEGKGKGGFLSAKSVFEGKKNEANNNNNEEKKEESGVRSKSNYFHFLFFK